MTESELRTGSAKSENFQPGMYLYSETAAVSADEQRARATTRFTRQSGSRIAPELLTAVSSSRATKA